MKLTINAKDLTASIDRRQAVRIQQRGHPGTRMLQGGCRR